MFIDELNMGLLPRSWFHKAVHVLGTLPLNGKGKVTGAAISIEGHADSVWNIKECITIDLLEKGAAVNSAFYCQILRQNSRYNDDKPRIKSFV